jgi:DNA-binding PadR family transcriptional regulator
VKELSGGRIEWSEGMLYPVLHRLEQEGLIEAQWKESDSGKRRKYYRLRSSGRTALGEEREQCLRFIKHWKNYGKQLAF